VRLIAAASRDLKTLIAGGRFREELYYRINVIDITLPPLRERKCDIPLLARHFLDRYGARLNKTGLRLSREAESILLSHSFPGNIRELENLVQRAVVLAEGGLIEPRHFPEDLVSGAPGFSYRPGRGRKPSPSSSFRESKRRAMEAFEREYLSECLKTSKGNVSLAARCAGMDVKNFRDKTKKYGIQPASFKVSARSVKQVDDRRSKQD
jgi:Nif-specific regulatory protein